MKIRLTDIPITGLPVAEILSKAALNQRLSEGDNHGIEFIDDLDVRLTVYRSAGGAETKGTVRSKYRQPCSRCAEAKERTLELATSFLLQPRPVTLEGERLDECEDDVGISYFDGEHVDLEDLIHETIILSLSLYWHPEEDSAGKCTLCPRMTRTKPVQSVQEPGETVLGALFKKAGIS
jgi:uncharacterized metal-binding protein YceD (DUF177 family)